MTHEMKIVQFNKDSMRLHVKCTCGAWAADYRDELNHQKRDFRRHWELATNVTPALATPPRRPVNSPLQSEAMFDASLYG